VQDFFAENPGAGAVIVDLLMAALVLVGLALIRMKFGHINDSQGRQDVRIRELEDDVSTLKGENVGTSREVQNLAANLERYVEDLKEQLRLEADLRREAEQRNEKSHDEIKSLLKAEA
jgi:hypothetical protein